MAVSEPVTITASEARSGTERTLTFPDTSKQIVLTIPKGIEDGQKIRIVYHGQIFFIPIAIIDDPPARTESKSRSLLGKAFWSLSAAAIVGFFSLYCSGILQQTGLGKMSFTKPGFENYEYDSRFAHNCKAGEIESANSTAIKDEAMRIGRQLEIEHGYDLTSRTTITIQYVPGQATGSAQISSLSSTYPEYCIRLEPQITGQVRTETIKHEWSHIAAYQQDPNAHHGPTWQTIAEAMDVDTSRYFHCGDGDSDCEPHTW